VTVHLVCVRGVCSLTGLRRRSGAYDLPMPAGGVHLTLGTDDEELRSLCRMYWETTDDGGWAHRVRDLAERFGVSAQRMAPAVAEASTARYTGEACSSCGEGRVVTSRSDVQTRRSYGRYYSTSKT
jgi:hypothetical protein